MRESIRIQGFSDLFFPAFGLEMSEKKKLKTKLEMWALFMQCFYRHSSRSVSTATLEEKGN